ELVADHAEEKAGLALEGLVVVVGEVVGLLTEPDAIEAEAPADADDVFVEAEAFAFAGEEKDAGELPFFDVGNGGDFHATAQAPNADPAGGGGEADLVVECAFTGVGGLELRQVDGLVEG